jgi:hypothetical protein
LSASRKVVIHAGGGNAFLVAVPAAVEEAQRDWEGIARATAPAAVKDNGALMEAEAEAEAVALEAVEWATRPHMRRATATPGAERRRIARMVLLFRGGCGLSVSEATAQHNIRRINDQRIHPALEAAWE